MVGTGDTGGAALCVSITKSKKNTTSKQLIQNTGPGFGVKKTVLSPPSNGREAKLPRLPPTT